MVFSTDCFSLNIVSFPEGPLKKGVFWRPEKSSLHKEEDTLPVKKSVLSLKFIFSPAFAANVSSLLLLRPRAS